MIRIRPRRRFTRPLSASSPRAVVVRSRVAPTRPASWLWVSRTASGSAEGLSGRAITHSACAVRSTNDFDTRSVSRSSSSRTRRPSCSAIPGRDPAVGQQQALHIGAADQAQVAASSASAHVPPMRNPSRSICPNTEPGPGTAVVTVRPSGTTRNRRNRPALSMTAPQPGRVGVEHDLPRGNGPAGRGSGQVCHLPP